ncbi:MAG TPA: carboxymuconolactone decarboxylase family protein [Gemmatimonadaceae bacterium]|nr:carboxymuconolactone decarboxylase family protein [Gemmatimonadaceae bacterium]
MQAQADKTLLDEETRAIVRISAVIAGGSEADVRRELELGARVAAGGVIDEIILQSYLFAGFPRALNAARAWRAIDPAAPARVTEPAAGDRVGSWRERGEATCRVVYGGSYDKLRANVRALHPDLDEWMIVDGYGKVLGRPGLDLKRRELAVVAACAATGQQRQLHSHLHGALNAGASEGEISATLDAISDLVPKGDAAGYRQLLDKIHATRARGLG